MPGEAGEVPLREEVSYLQGQLLELQHLSQDQDAELDRLRCVPAAYPSAAQHTAGADLAVQV